MADYIAALPNDILPLLAAVCAVPPIERCGELIRRGRFELDLAARHDAVINAPVLDDSDMAALWEILGGGVVDTIVYRRVTYTKSIIHPNWFNGAAYGLVEVGDGDTIMALGTSVHATINSKYYNMCTVTSGGDIDPTYLIINVTSGQDSVYWLGCRKSVNWFAARVRSVMLLRITLSWLRRAAVKNQI